MLSLQDREWKTFTIGNLFEIRNGKRLEKENQIPGNRPFIGSSDSNNGITGFVENKNVSLDKNCIGVNYNGSIGEAFYHPYECIFSDDVKHLHLLNHKDNKHISLFLCTAIRMQKDKFQYGYKMNSTRMRRQSILLPATAVGEPDWQFMEDFIKERENIIISRYKQYKF